MKQKYVLKGVNKIIYIVKQGSFIPPPLLFFLFLHVYGKGEETIYFPSDIQERNI